MTRTIKEEILLFDVSDVFGQRVRTTKVYWEKITELKHTELVTTIGQVTDTLRHPDEVYRSVQDEYIKIFYKRFNGKYLVVLVKYLQEQGFVVTCYQTTKDKRKGTNLWPK